MHRISIEIGLHLSDKGCYKLKQFQAYSPTDFEKLKSK